MDNIFKELEVKNIVYRGKIAEKPDSLRPIMEIDHGVLFADSESDFRYIVEDQKKSLLHLIEINEFNEERLNELFEIVIRKFSTDKT